jgi:hypothetical protein
MNAPQSRDFPWTGTGGLSDTQSYQWIIHNAIYDRLATSSFFSSFAVKRLAAALPVEAYTQIPFIGIFFVEDMGNNDGDVNAGDIRLLHNFTIGVQIVVKNNDPTAMLQMLDRAWWFALNQLLRDNTLMNRLHTTMPDNVTIEGVPRLRLVPDRWGLAGLKNETPLGERIFYITYQIRTEWYPTDFPELERISVTTAFPFGADDTTQGQTQQVKVVYEFTPDSVPTPLPPDPVLTSISPTTAVHGTAMFLTAVGTDFDSTAQVCLNGLPQTTTFVASTELQATIPNTFAAGTYNVTVQNNAGAVTGVQIFTLT